MAASKVNTKIELQFGDKAVLSLLISMLSLKREELIT